MIIKIDQQPASVPPRRISVAEGQHSWMDWRDADHEIGPGSMNTLGLVAATIVGLLHFYFLVLEMFLWTKPAGLRAFHLTPEQARASRVLAANQGLYNGFLGAGLIWSAWLRPDFDVILFFLACVIVAGIYGALTSSRKILYVQTVPALVALILLHIPI